MPLPSPILDDRSFAQLRDALIRRIPAYAPEWTDHNESDPGVTLIELFAFLGEALLYRFNQIPETTQLAFLDLLGVPLRPAVPAQVPLMFTATRPQGVLVPTGTEVLAGKRPFETIGEVRVWPAEALGIAKLPVDALPAEDQALAEEALDAAGGLGADDTVAYYANQQISTDPNAPDASAVDFANAVDRSLWVAVLGPKDGDPAAARAHMAGGLINLGVALDPEVLTMAEVVAEIGACPGDEVATGDSVRWQISTGAIVDGRDTRYRDLTVAGDLTAALNRSGVVRLALPQQASWFGRVDAADLDDPDLAGTGALPPALEDPEVAARVLFWLRAFRPSGGALPRLAWIGLNVAEAEQRRTARPEFLGVGTGQPDQEVQLVNGQIAPESLILEVEEDDRWLPWRPVDGFHASTESDPHYVLDAEAGTIRFGRVVQGRVPQLGQRIRARGYRFGGGVAGNVPAGAIDKIGVLNGIEEPDGFRASVADLEVTNPLAARGGADAESLDAALERIPNELKRRDRAVTPGDFRALAQQTPGAELGRVEVLARFDPANPDRVEPAAGVVSVMIWPARDPRHPDAPQPDRATLRRVCQWLDARRLITTELYVIPPTYRRVAVSINVQVKPGHGIDAVRQWVELALRQLLAPLPPYGPDGAGWPLGRRVHAPELEAAALQVEGVSHVEDGHVQVAGWDGAAWIPGTVSLTRYEVPELAHIAVTAAAPAPIAIAQLVEDEATPAPQPDQPPIPVPIIPEEC